MTYHLFLDDERDPPSDGTDWIVVRRVETARATVHLHGLPSFISFDHDLGEGEPTGYDFVRWLADHIMDHDLPYEGLEWYVHSQNPVGATNINTFLGNFLPVWQAHGWGRAADEDANGR